MNHAAMPSLSAGATVATKQFFNHTAFLDRLSGQVVVENAGDGTSYQTDLKQTVSELGKSIDLLYSVEATGYTLRKLLETYSEGGGDFDELMVSGLVGLLKEITYKVGEEAVVASHRLELLKMFVENTVWGQ